MDGLKKAARISQILMGLVFLVSGLIKVWEPVLFYWEVVPFTQLLGMVKFWQQAAQVILLLAPFECALGLALLANWRPRLTFPVAVVLMVFFIGLMVHAWNAGATENCGCFGTLVDRSPAEAAVEDGVMLALLLFGWWGARSLPSWRFSGRLVGAGMVLSLAVGCIQFFPDKARLAESDLKPGVELTGLNPQGLDVDVMKGEYLVELMSPRCGHCIDAVPKLNRLVDEADLPPLIALNTFAQDSQPLKEFKERLQPRFAIGTISRTDFFRLTWKHTYPRLAYLRDGVVQMVWEHNEFPNAEQLRIAIGHTSP